MDEVLRRRLIGAAIVFAALFVLVSLLPAPGTAPAKDGEVVTIDLMRPSAAPAAADDALAADVAPDAAPAEEPVATPSSTEAKPGPALRMAPKIAQPPAAQADETPPPAPAKQPSKATSAPAQTQPQISTPAPMRLPPVGEGDWWVQVASLGDFEAAHSLLTRLQTLGYAARVQRAELSGRSWYRVRVGPYRSREDAAAAQARVEASGFGDTAIVQAQP